MSRFLLDTDTFSYLVKDVAPVVDAVAALRPGQAVLSIITLGEYLYGAARAAMTPKRSHRAESLIELLGVEPLSDACAREYARIRHALAVKGTPFGPNDLWIAAHALAENLTLVTNNTREFKRVPGLKLANWME